MRPLLNSYENQAEITQENYRPISLMNIDEKSYEKYWHSVTYNKDYTPWSFGIHPQSAILFLTYKNQSLLYTILID